MRPHLVTALRTSLVCATAAACGAVAPVGTADGLGGDPQALEAAAADDVLSRGHVRDVTLDFVGLQARGHVRRPDPSPLCAGLFAKIDAGWQALAGSPDWRALEGGAPLQQARRTAREVGRQGCGAGRVRPDARPAVCAALAAQLGAELKALAATPAYVAVHALPAYGAIRAAIVAGGPAGCYRDAPVD